MIFRERADLAEDLVFYENYLGKTDATFTLNFSTGSAMVLAQYYQLVRLGQAGYTSAMETMAPNARALADGLRSLGQFELIGEDREQLPLVAFKLGEDKPYDEFDIAWQLSAERGRLRDARAQGRRSRVRAQAGEDRRRLLSRCDRVDQPDRGKLVRSCGGSRCPRQ